VSEHPEAVLLDVGGIFLLPDRTRILGAFTRAECEVTAARVDAAHYPAAAQFTVDLDVESDWAGAWRRYLDAYITACDIPDDCREVAHEHLDSEFADAALWSQPIEGAKDALAAIAATGARIGIVSNADGMIGQRLAEREILQVGPGVGVEVECVIDSGNVGVMKPDPRIFRIALDAMGVDPAHTWYVGDMPAFDVVGARRAGLRPFLLSPVHRGGEGFDVVPSLAALSELVARSRNGSPPREPGTPDA
jgi:putative hydrolase of the HAD superfamily